MDAVCLTVSVSLLLRLYIKKDLDMFEPIVVIGGLYILMYFFTPIYDLCIGQYTWYGYDLFKYGIKATLIAFAGFIGFYVFYENRLFGATAQEDFGKLIIIVIETIMQKAERKFCI